MNLRRLGSSLAAVLVVAGCATQTKTQAPNPGASKPATVTKSLNLSGYPPEFRKGFTEGCAVARGQKSSARPKDESQYAAGWADGYDYCVSRK